ncbi:MAG: hypothetical protein ABIP17_05910 [Ilumatobacteraceae bacterium]
MLRRRAMFVGIAAEFLTRDVDTIVDLARRDGIVRIVLREIVGTYPEMVIADWSTYNRDRPEWFAPDGIHLRRAGPWAVGDYISRKTASLDDRPCPQPVRPGKTASNPCPDPDTTGPIADLDALYPIGEPYPREPFLLEFESSC